MVDPENSSSPPINGDSLPQPGSRLRRGQELELDVDSMAFGGQGIARLQTFVVFVAGAVPGDRVRALVTKVKRNYAEARLEKILTPSADRVDASCRHYGSCGAEFGLPGAAALQGAAGG
jgi:23S rRNA (uracil1939-C5)-methyltransferase